MRIAAAVAVVTLLPVAGLAQGLTIEHRPIGCVVAGKYPVFNACFTPAAELARARVYFRATDSPHWYYVDMKSETPCFTGTLPRPKKDIGGLSYYVEATDRAFNPARTDETATRVVGNQMECQKDVPVAPFLDKATVVVGAAPGAPIVPLGFAAGGGLPAAAAAGIVGAGAAGAGAVVASNNNDGTTTTVTPGTTAPGTTPPTTTPPPTTPPTPPPTTAPAINRLPTIRLDYSPASGDSPLAVTFNLCRSTDPDPGDVLRYKFDFDNDGTFEVSGSSCRESHTYRGTVGQEFTARLCIDDRIAGHEDVCETGDVEITGPTLCKAGDTEGPKVSWLEPAVASGFATAAAFDQTLKVDTSDASGTAYVDFYANLSGGALQGEAASAAAPPGYVGRDTTGPPFSVVWNGAESCNCYELLATAVDNCGNSTDEYQYFCTYDTCRTPSAGSELTWVSEFAVPGASAQLVLNGTAAFFPAGGRVNGRATVKAGENRFEGQLVIGNGTAGTWRLELPGDGRVVPGSLRVLAGEAVAVEATAVTFRLQGRVGERVVVTFRTR